MRNSIFVLIIIGLFFSGCEDVQKYIKTIDFLEKQNAELQAINKELQKKLDSYENRSNNIKKNMFNASSTKSLDKQVFDKNLKCVQGNCTNGTGRLEGQGYVYQGEFKDSKLVNGTQDQFFSNGNKEFEGKWKDGFLNGKAIIYYENGNKKGEGYFKNGKEHGWFFEYTANGDILEELYYKNGVQQ